MNIIVQRVADPIGWDVDLDDYNGSLFLSSAWLSSLANGERMPVYLLFRHNDKTIAMLSGIDAPVRKSKRRQLFFYSALALKDKDIYQVQFCKQALYAYARAKGYVRISLKSYDQHSIQSHGSKLFKEFSRMEYLFDLGKGQEDVVKRFSPDFRRRARKAEREGVVFRQSYSTDLITPLFELLHTTLNTRRAKGYGNYTYLYLPFFNRKEMEALLRKKAATFFYVEHAQKILSIQFVIAFRKKAYGIFMGTGPEGYKTGTPSFLFHKGVEYLCQGDYQYYNLGGVQRRKSHKGLKKFKDSMGARVIESMEESTNFLHYPLRLLNPLMNLKRFSEHADMLPWRIRKPVIALCDFILAGRDKY